VPLGTFRTVVLPLARLHPTAGAGKVSLSSELWLAGAGAGGAPPADVVAVGRGGAAAGDARALLGAALQAEGLRGLLQVTQRSVPVFALPNM
jgi:hypothetical protein